MRTSWGTNGQISLPEVIDSSVDSIDMEGFCFTAQGIRVNVTHAEREETVAAGFKPVPHG